MDFESKSEYLLDHREWAADSAGPWCLPPSTLLTICPVGDRALHLPLGQGGGRGGLLLLELTRAETFLLQVAPPSGALATPARGEAS